MKIKVNPPEASLINQIAIKTGFTPDEVMAFFIEMGNTFIITVMNKRAIDVMKEFKTMVKNEPKLKIMVDVIQKSIKNASNININQKQLNDGKSSNDN